MERTSAASVSFRERSLWIQLLSTAAVYSAYFLAVALGVTGAAAASLLVGVIALQGVAGIVLGVYFAVRTRPEPADERDRAIARGATRVAYFVLAGGVMLVIVALLWGSSAWGRPFLTGNLLLACFVVSEVVRQGAQVVAYRKGA